MNNRLALTLVFAVFTAFLFWFVSIRQSLLFIVGLGLGGVLAGARFGFTTGWRNLIEKRDASGVFAQLLLLAIAAGISLPLLAFFPTELSAALGPPSISLRSEEHTSELQSRPHLVCRLLLEKKKKKKQKHKN